MLLFRYVLFYEVINNKWRVVPQNFKCALSAGKMESLLSRVLLHHCYSLEFVLTNERDSKNSVNGLWWLINYLLWCHARIRFGTYSVDFTVSLDIACNIFEKH